MTGEGLRRVGFLKRTAPLRQAEIEQLDPLFGDQNICGLEIAVRDAFLMRRVERVQNLPSVFDCPVERQRAFGAPSINSITR